MKSTVAAPAAQGAIDYAEPLPTEGDEAFIDDTNYPLFGTAEKAAICSALSAAHLGDHIAAMRRYWNAVADLLRKRATRGCR